MNQEKIGKFIAKCRKEKKLTQVELANKLGCSDKSVSKWENGICMPELSLFNSLCEILGITVNDLMSGEKVDNKDYINVLEENIVNIMSETESRNKRKRIMGYVIGSFCLLILVVGYLFYNYYEVDVLYDSNMMKCNIDGDTLVFESIGQSVINYDYITKDVEDKKMYFFHGTINIYNKRRSNWEYSRSLSSVIEGKEPQFGHRHILDIDKKDKIVVYYTEMALNKLDKLASDEIIDILDDSYLMCEFE